MRNSDMQQKSRNHVRPSNMSLSRSQQQSTASQQQQPAPVQPKDGLGGPCAAPGGFIEVLYQGKLPINRPSGDSRRFVLF